MNFWQSLIFFNFFFSDLHTASLVHPQPAHRGLWRANVGRGRRLGLRGWTGKQSKQVTPYLIQKFSQRKYFLENVIKFCFCFSEEKCLFLTQILGPFKIFKDRKIIFCNFFWSLPAPKFFLNPYPPLWFLINLMYVHNKSIELRYKLARWSPQLTNSVTN